MKKNKKIWLNLGSGVSLADGFINVDNFFDRKDLEEGQRTKNGLFTNARIKKDTKFIRADICDLPFPDNYADYIECNDVIEHQQMGDVVKALKEMYRVLKSGCKLGLSTTNFDELAKLWTINVTGNSFKTKEDWERFVKLQQVIYGNQAGPGEFHKTAFNPFIIGYYLQSAGFNLKNVVINIYPTNTPYLAPQKAYAHVKNSWKNVVVLTEQMFIIATK